MEWGGSGVGVGQKPRSKRIAAGVVGRVSGACPGLSLVVNV